MKLHQVDFYLDWPVSIEVLNLRDFITTYLMKKGEILRWSIIDIQKPKDTCNTKKLRIHAVLVN